MKGLNVVVTLLLLSGAEQLASHLREHRVLPLHSQSSSSARDATKPPVVDRNLRLISV